MSTQESKQVNTGAQIAAAEVQAGSKTAGKVGKKAAQTGRTIFSLLPTKAKIIVIVMIFFILIFAVFVQGTGSSSMKRVIRQNAVGESNTYNNPKEGEETYDALYNKGAAVEDTIELVKVIHEAKKKDYDKIQASIESAIKKRAKQLDVNVDVDASVQHAKMEWAESSGLAYSTGIESLNSADIKLEDYVSDDVVIGRANTGENGKNQNEPGDQTKSEVATTSEYGSWEYIIRAKDDAAKLKLAYAMRMACDNDHIGYEEKDGGSFYKEAGKVSWDPAGI